MTDYRQLVDETLIRLSGYTQRQDQATFLVSNMAIDAYTFQVADGVVLTRGIVEIGDELVWVDRFDQSTSTGYIPPYGRGFRNTKQSAHSAGDRVTIAPSFPRSQIAHFINDAISGVYPDLFGIGYIEFPFVAVRTTYELPPDAIEAQQVSWQTIGPSREWLPVRNFRMDIMASPTAFPSGRTISVYDAMVPGRPVRVVYTKVPSQLEYMTDDFTDTGLPESAKEVVILGAAYRAASFLDLGRIPAQSAEADAIQANDPVGTGASASRLLFQLYSQRLAQEVRQQQERFPVRVRHTR